MSDWIMPLSSFVGAALGAAVVVFIHWLDTRSHYRRSTFEQRLKVHQEAICLCYELYRTLSIGKPDEKYAIIRRIELWWESNCLSLDTRSRKSLFMLTGAAYDHIQGFAQSQGDIWKAIIKTRDLIANGIGEQYLPPNKDDKKLRGIFGTKSD